LSCVYEIIVLKLKKKTYFEDILYIAFFPLLYHQSILDYKYMYVNSRKWQYKK